MTSKQHGSNGKKPSFERHTSRSAAGPAETVDRPAPSAQNSRSSPATAMLLSSPDVFRLQRVLGNRAVGRLLAAGGQRQSVRSRPLPGQAVVRRVIDIQPDSLLAPKKGRIKMRRLVTHIEEYHQMILDTEPFNTLTDKLLVIANKIQQYLSEMTVEERGIHEDAMESINKKVHREIQQLEQIQAPKVINTNNVVTMQVVDGRDNSIRQFDFSLARHWFPALASEGKEKNSVLHHDVSFDTISSDCVYIGTFMRDLWKSGVLEPDRLVIDCPSGRKYVMDIEGSSQKMNHFFVVSGTKVANVTADEYRFIREISAITSGQVDARQALAYWSVIKKDWIRKIPEMTAITGFDITSIGIKTLEQEIQETMNIAHEQRFTQDVRNFLKVNQTGELPSNFLTPQMWSIISSMDFGRASAAYNRLFRKHKLHFREAKDQSLGKNVLYGIDD